MMVTKENDETPISKDAPVSKDNMALPNPAIWNIQKEKDKKFENREPIEINWDLNEEGIEEYNKVNPSNKLEWNRSSTQNNNDTTKGTTESTLTLWTFIICQATDHG